MKKFSVTLTSSLIGCTESQKRTIAVLGLKKINSSKVFLDTPQFRGQIRKIQHLVRLEKGN